YGADLGLRGHFLSIISIMYAACLQGTNAFGFSMNDQKPNRVTCKMVNDALRARGRDESLREGDGYFYFGGGNAVHWLSSSVMVKRLNDLTLEQWLAEFDRLLDQDNKLRGQTDEQQPAVRPKRGVAKQK